MTAFTASELQQAQTALASTLAKCQKARQSPRLGRSQQTLLDRRVVALNIALALIARELEAAGNAPRGPDGGRA